MTRTLTYDGKNLKALSDPGFSDVYYTTSLSDLNTGQNIVGNFSTTKAYSTVSQAAHCIKIRATEVSRIPRGLFKLDGTEVTDDPMYKSLAEIGDLLYDLETSLCLYGTGYAFPTANASGFQVGLQWGASPSLLPRYNPMTQKLAWFDRRNGSMLSRLEVENVIYCWNFNPADENKPGPADLMSGLGAASALYAMDALVAAYMNSGGVKVTVFPVDPSTSEPDYKAFQNWLNRRVSGVVNAFRNIVMRVKGELKPVVIGSDLKDMEVGTLSDQKKSEVAIALDVPPNVVDGSYKYATADSEYLNFLAGVIIPRTDKILEDLNQQWFNRFGLKMVTQPEKMEIMQAVQLAQITSVETAVGKPIWTVDEGREFTGKPALGGTNAVLSDPIAQPGLMPPANAQALAVSEAVKPVPVGKPRPVQLMADTTAVAKAFTDWRTQALRSIKQGSVTLSNNPILPVDLRQSLNREMAACKTATDVRKAFERHWQAEFKDEPQGEAGMLALAASNVSLAEALMQATKALKEVEA